MRLRIYEKVSWADSSRRMKAPPKSMLEIKIGTHDVLFKRNLLYRMHFSSSHSSSAMASQTTKCYRTQYKGGDKVQLMNYSV